jgi:hypothetical protein
VIPSFTLVLMLVAGVLVGALGIVLVLLDASKADKHATEETAAAGRGRFEERRADPRAETGAPISEETEWPSPGREGLLERARIGAPQPVSPGGEQSVPGHNRIAARAREAVREWERGAAGGSAEEDRVASPRQAQARLAASTHPQKGLELFRRGD